MTTSPKKLNSILARTSLVTSIGDFLSLFGVLVVTHQLTGSIAIAALVAPVKSLGIAVGGGTLPFVLSRVRMSRLLIGSQIISVILAGALAYSAGTAPSLWVMAGALLGLTVLKQYFDGAREHLSKSLGQDSQQRTLQAEILQAFYGAQVIGPIAAVALIHFFGAVVPLWVDAASFVGASLMLLPLRTIADPEVKSYSILKPFQYLGQNKELLRIFLIRSVGYWIPVGIFNYFLFSVVTEKYGREALDSAWVYVAIGVGASISTTWLRAQKADTHSWLSHEKWSDAGLASMALLVLAATRLFFLGMPSFVLGLGAVIVSGLCTGVNAVTTQALRRKLCTASQFPEIVGLELVVGRLMDWGVSSLVAYGAIQGVLDVNAGMIISAGCLVVLAWVQRR